MSRTATSPAGDTCAVGATTACRLPRQVETPDGEIVADSGGSR